MVNFERLRTVNLYEKKDPIRDLWRNVLIVGIEDLLKKKKLQYQYDRKAYCLEEMWFHHEDFKLICEFAQLEHAIVKRKVFEAVEKLKEKHEKGKESMSEMSGQWLYKDKKISGRPKRRYSAMSLVQ
tara:strand:- start:2926 stop:3306 length:381 start_codon:yes stop_codon:yes gene_type:complete